MQDIDKKQQKGIPLRRSERIRNSTKIWLWSRTTCFNCLCMKGPTNTSRALHGSSLLLHICGLFATFLNSSLNPLIFGAEAPSAFVPPWDNFGKFTFFSCFGQRIWSFRPFYVCLGQSGVLGCHLRSLFKCCTKVIVAKQLFIVKVVIMNKWLFLVN